MQSTPVFVITGQLAAGKSTVARAVLAHFDHAYLVDVDALREMVVEGLASPLAWTEETTRQFGLALDGAARLAAVYHAAGFAVAIEGAFDAAAAVAALEGAGLRDALVGVELCPPLDSALARNRARRHKPFDPEILEPAMRRIDAGLRRDPPPAGFTRLDNGGQTIDETVAAVLALSRR